MVQKRLALNIDGQMTYCSASEENIGKGRCNHIEHQKNGESQKDFLIRLENKQNNQEKPKSSKELLNKFNDLSHIALEKKIKEQQNLTKMHRRSYEEAIVERHKDSYKKIIAEDYENLAKLQKLREKSLNSENLSDTEQNDIHNLGKEFIKGKLDSNKHQLDYEKRQLSEQKTQRNIDYVQSKIDTLENKNKEYQNILNNLRS